jgi:hypothetical protein
MERLMWEKLKEHFNVEDFFNPKCKIEVFMAQHT